MTIIRDDHRGPRLLSTLYWSSLPVNGDQPSLGPYRPRIVLLHWLHDRDTIGYTKLEFLVASRNYARQKQSLDYDCDVEAHECSLTVPVVIKRYDHETDASRANSMFRSTLDRSEITIDLITIIFEISSLSSLINIYYYYYFIIIFLF